MRIDNATVLVGSPPHGGTPWSRSEPSCPRDYRLRLTFSDNLARELDLEGLEGEVFEPLHDRSVFAQVSVDTVAGTIQWPNGVDLDPAVLHGNREPASGHGPVLLKE
ncbi:MAG: DUF2442 domain-containing protein [Acidimicrobiales bacterium]